MRTACSATATRRSSAPTTRPPWRPSWPLRASSQPTARRSASSCCSRPARSTRSPGAKAFDPARLQLRVRLRVRPRVADRRAGHRLPDLLPPGGRVPRQGGPRRHPARGGPQRDRGCRQGRLRPSRSAVSTRPRPPTSARSRAAPPRTWSPSAAEVVLEARSLDDARAGEVVSSMVDAISEAASDLECDVETTVERLFRGFRLSRTAPVVEVAAAALGSLGIEPVYINTGGGSDANAFDRRRAARPEHRQRHRGQSPARRVGHRRRAGDVRST